MTKSLHSTRYNEFRQRLTKARMDAGVSQAELANQLGKPQSFVSKFERGERRLDVIEFLDVVTILGIAPASFLDELQSSAQ